MEKTDNLLKDIKKNIYEIVKRLASYEKVDATLSEKTLLKVSAYLKMADEALEKGFVEDACKEIDDYFKAN